MLLLGCDRDTGGDADAGPNGADGSAGMPCTVQLAAGVDHTCARTVDGSIWCWTTASPTPARVPGFNGAIAVAAGDHHTCALQGGGAAYCWGQNESGQLGDGSTSPSDAPVSVTLLPGAVAIGAGRSHT